MGPNRQNKESEERRPISTTTSKQKLGVAFGSRSSKIADPIMPSAKKSSVISEHRSSARKDAGERLLRQEEAPKGFARLQQMARRANPLVVNHDESELHAVQGVGLSQSSRASELKGESEYLKFSGENLSEDQLDKLMQQNRNFRRR